MSDQRGHLSLESDDQNRFLKIIRESLKVRRHLDLYNWLQGDLQNFVPHQILLAAWGDLRLGVLYVDVISPLPGMRTGLVISRDISGFVRNLFKLWEANDCDVTRLSAPAGFQIDTEQDDCTVEQTFNGMHSAVLHGLRDERGQHYCLYCAFNTAQSYPERTVQYMELLLPHIDTALRQVTHLPEQRHDSRDAPENASEPQVALSDREVEILEWVRSGKTNEEIGVILSISAFTVKNHLQRIFRKLDVTNRAQAVAKLPRINNRGTTNS